MLSVKSAPCSVLRMAGSLVSVRWRSSASTDWTVVTQGLRLADVRSRICSPGFSRAAHAILQTHAAAVPSLPRPSPRAVGAALVAMAPRLRFVAACRARTVLRDGGSDVSRAGAASQVGLPTG